MGAVQSILLIAAAYLVVGAVFALAFVWRGAVRIDPAAARSSFGARIIFLPGAAALWPILAARWARGGKGAAG